MKCKIQLSIFIILISSLSLSAQTQPVKADSLQTQKSDLILYNYPHETASYPGGVSAWQKHLKKHIKSLKPPCESGKVTVRFTVLKSGKTDSVQVVRRLCELADKNAIEIVKKSGLWQPAYLKNEPVDSWAQIQLVYRYKR